MGWQITYKLSFDCPEDQAGLKIAFWAIGIIFSSISLNMWFGCSKEPSHPDGSFKYPQHMFWLRNKKIKFQIVALLSGGPVKGFIKFGGSSASPKGVKLYNY